MHVCTIGVGIVLTHIQSRHDIHGKLFQLVEVELSDSGR